MDDDYLPSDNLVEEPDEMDSGPPSSQSRSLPSQHSTVHEPQFMTVGSGPQSQYAAELMAEIERDSGYGSMLNGSGGNMRRFPESLLQDRETPVHTPRADGQPGPNENERRILASHIHQLHYNQNRVALAKAIGQTVQLLKQLQETNSQWPAHYPSVQRSQPDLPQPSPSSRPPFSHTQSTKAGTDFHRQPPLGRPTPPRRAGTTTGHEPAESSTATQPIPKDEPRLVTPQIAQEFSILKLDLKVGALSQTELVHSLEKRSIASLLDGKISGSIRHLLLLRDRIEDTSSKVLVTGDLNAGKSTFCNALLRRKILPEDQQPCTSIFCEVLDAKENGDVEEVHAVHKDTIYIRNDESTFDSYSLQELEKIVLDNEKYMQCKVYVKDIRTVDESLLNNGVVDIALIDAPGLNADSVKTTAVFARQEEIDVVVFVVSAANHFTLSAKDFIWQAAHEKAYMFMVVNGFDNIRDKDRCKTQILSQLAKLSPQTFKEAEELVHFVSSNAIPTQPMSSAAKSQGGSGSQGRDGDDDGNDDDDDDKLPTGKHEGPDSPDLKGKGKDKEKIQDFTDLEGALRRFVLDKRARSKLAPARTYLMNCLGDMNVLATVNKDVAQSELDRVSEELAQLEPEYEKRNKQKSVVSEQVDKDVDGMVSDVYNHTRSTIAESIANVASTDLGIVYPGLFSAFQYAEDIRLAMLDSISASVSSCENYGRATTIRGVSMIKQLGLLHVGDTYQSLNFRADMMFHRRKDALNRAVDTEIELLDFLDVAGLWERQEKYLGGGLAMTVVGTVGSRALGGFGWTNAFGAAKAVGFNNLQRLIVPGAIAAVALTFAYMLTVIPQTLPPRLARKLSATLNEIDYTHTNAARISAEVRRVLRFPSQQLAVDLQRGVEELKQKKENITQVKRESEIARTYFANLVRDTSAHRRRVEGIDLEGPLAGGAGGHVS